MSVNMIPKAKELKLVSIWWFPLLPTYEAFRILAEVLLSGYLPQDCDLDTSLMDSLPIISCSGKRMPSVAKEITDKGFCSTKSVYYFQP